MCRESRENWRIGDCLTFLLSFLHAGSRKKIKRPMQAVSAGWCVNTCLGRLMDTSQACSQALADKVEAWSLGRNSVSEDVKVLKEICRASHASVCKLKT